MMLKRLFSAKRRFQSLNTLNSPQKANYSSNFHKRLGSEAASKGWTFLTLPGFQRFSLGVGLELSLGLGLRLNLELGPANSTALFT
jgi:hypothetical protein